MSFRFADYLKKFISSYPEFAKQKFELREIFEVHKGIEKKAKNIMLDVIYHDLVKVREMYKATFSIEFPGIKEPIRCVQIRHDLVHRNGKNKTGENIVLSQP